MNCYKYTLYFVIILFVVKQLISIACDILHKYLIKSRGKNIS